MRTPEIDHWLDGEDHPRLEHRAGAGWAKVQNVRLVVEKPTEAVADKVAHHAHAFAFGNRLDRCANVAGRISGLGGLDASGEAFIGHFNETLGLPRNFTHRIHAAGITMPAVNDERQVDIEDIALAQWPAVRNSVADDVVERGADRMAVAPVKD